MRVGLPVSEDPSAIIVLVMPGLLYDIRLGETREVMANGRYTHAIHSSAGAGPPWVLDDESSLSWVIYLRFGSRFWSSIEASVVSWRQALPWPAR